MGNVSQAVPRSEMRSHDDNDAIVSSTELIRLLSNSVHGLDHDDGVAANHGHADLPKGEESRVDVDITRTSKGGFSVILIRFRV